MRITIHVDNQIVLEIGGRHIINANICSDAAKLAEIYLDRARPCISTVRSFVEYGIIGITGGPSRYMSEEADPADGTGRIECDIVVGYPGASVIPNIRR